eukprot:1157797-Pelagomonas_calceolata.AAC.1
MECKDCRALQLCCGAIKTGVLDRAELRVCQHVPISKHYVQTQAKALTLTFSLRAGTWHTCCLAFHAMAFAFCGALRIREGGIKRPCMSVEEVLHNIDTAIQYGEDAEVKVRDMEGGPGAMEAGDDDIFDASSNSASKA